MIEAFFWDGKTNFDKNKEDIDVQNERIEEFGRWLENDDKK